MSLQVEHLVERDGAACVWCSRELWLRDLTRLLERLSRSKRRGHRDEAARQLRRLQAVSPPARP